MPRFEESNGVPIAGPRARKIVATEEFGTPGVEILDDRGKHASGCTDFDPDAEIRSSNCAGRFTVGRRPR